MVIQSVLRVAAPMMLLFGETILLSHPFPARNSFTGRPLREDYIGQINAKKSIDIFCEAAKKSSLSVQCLKCGCRVLGPDNVFCHGGAVTGHETLWFRKGDCATFAKVVDVVPPSEMIVNKHSLLPLGAEEGVEEKNIFVKASLVEKAALCHEGKNINADNVNQVSLSFIEVEALANYISNYNKLRVTQQLQQNASTSTMVFPPSVPNLYTFKRTNGSLPAQYKFTDAFVLTDAIEGISLEMYVSSLFQSSAKTIEHNNMFGKLTRDSDGVVGRALSNEDVRDLTFRSVVLYVEVARRLKIHKYEHCYLEPTKVMLDLHFVERLELMDAKEFWRFIDSPDLTNIWLVDSMFLHRPQDANVRSYGVVENRLGYTRDELSYILKCVISSDSDNSETDSDCSTTSDFSDDEDAEAEAGGVLNDSLELKINLERACIAEQARKTINKVNNPPDAAYSTTTPRLFSCEKIKRQVGHLYGVKPMMLPPLKEDQARVADALNWISKIAGLSLNDNVAKMLKEMDSCFAAREAVEQKIYEKTQKDFVNLYHENKSAGGRSEYGLPSWLYTTSSWADLILTALEQDAKVQRACSLEGQLEFFNNFMDVVRRGGAESLFHPKPIKKKEIGFYGQGSHTQCTKKVLSRDGKRGVVTPHVMTQREFLRLDNN